MPRLRKKNISEFLGIRVEVEFRSQKSRIRWALPWTVLVINEVWLLLSIK